MDHEQVSKSRRGDDLCSTSKSGLQTPNTSHDIRKVEARATADSRTRHGYAQTLYEAKEEGEPPTFRGAGRRNGCRAAGQCGLCQRRIEYARERIEFCSIMGTES